MKSVKTSLFFVAMAAVLALCGSTRAAEGPISYWRFDEGEGTTASDSVGSNHGAIHGATWITGIVNSALSFDAAADYVRILDSDQFTLGDDYTVEAWINPDDTANAWKAIMGTYSPKGVYNGGFMLVLGNGDDNELLFWANGLWGYSGYEIKEDGNWKHVVYTTSSGSVGTFYVNGVSVATVAAAKVTNGHDLHIGDGGELWAIYDFYGSIDEVAIYNRALSEQEIEERYLETFDLKIIAIGKIEQAIAEKLEALERIDVALGREWAAYEALEELLASGDYGDLNKGDIVTAKQKIHSAIQHEEQSKNALEKSLQKLEDSLWLLGS